jgi:hypothetical protein
MNHDTVRDMSWVATLAGFAGAAITILFAARQMGVSGVSQRPAPSPVRVRDAGRDQMAMPPRDWDQMDETLDASFPASDPPGNY